MAADISFKVSADLAEIRTALQGLRSDFQAAGQNARASFGDAGVAKMRGELAQLRTEFQRTAAEGRKGFSDLGLDGISSQLRGLRNLMGGFAASIAGALGVRELVTLADTYSQLTGRLRVATKATGDFREVQAGLINVARETHAPLTDIVNLYASIAPALNEVGIGSQRTIGVLRTVSQALATSGGSAQSTAAALQQLAQGLGSNNLAGEELRSVLEQARPVAQALADGLGVPVGKLKEMASNGEITAEVFARAFEKVKDKVAADAQAMGTTIAMASNDFNNSLLLLVGGVDQASGASAAFADAVIAVSKGIDAIAPFVTDVLNPMINIVVNFIDVVGRLFNTVGTGLAGYALMAKQALSFDFDGVLETYRQLSNDIEDIWTAPLNAQKVAAREAAREAKQQADARKNTEEDLAAELSKLENLRKVAAGEASADILAGEKELATARYKIADQALKDRVKAEESAVDKMRDLYLKSIEDEKKARDEAAKIRTDAAASADNLRDRASQRRGSGMSESQREEMNTRAASSLTARATLTAGQAQVAVRDGDLKKAERLAAEAAKLAERAEKAADAIKDDDTAARALEDLARVQEKIGETQAQGKEKEAEQQDALAKSIDEQIKLAEQRITNLKTVIAQPITLSADIAEAEKSIKTLEERLANLPDKTVTVTVQTVNAPGTPAEAAASIPALATGGKLTGPGSDRSDNLLLWGSPGEWMINARASRYYGDGFMHRLNSMQLPRFADGGPLTPGVRAAANESAGSVAATFNFPGMSPIAARVDRRTAATLARELRREARKAGR